MLAALGEDFREQQKRLLDADASVAEMTCNAGEMQSMLSWLTAAHAEESASRQAFEHQVRHGHKAPVHQSLSSQIHFGTDSVRPGCSSQSYLDLSSQYACTAMQPGM